MDSYSDPAVAVDMLWNGYSRTMVKDSPNYVWPAGAKVVRIADSSRMTVAYPGFPFHCASTPMMTETRLFWSALVCSSYHLYQGIRY